MTIIKKASSYDDVRTNKVHFKLSCYGLKVILQYEENITLYTIKEISSLDDILKVIRKK